MATYIGTITEDIYRDKSSIGPGKYTTQLSYLTNYIGWKGAVPSDLQGQNLQQILNNPNYGVTYQYNIKITGSQRYDTDSQPYTQVTIKTPAGDINKKYKTSTPSDIQGTGKYNVNDTFSGKSYPTSITLTITNDCFDYFPFCTPHGATNYTFTLQLIIYATAKNPPQTNNSNQNMVQSTNGSLTYPGITDTNGQPINATSHVVVHHVMY